MSTRERVLGALEDAGAEGLSGETLARELGVSRVAVGKHVAALREAGYRIEAEPGAGYRLLSSPDLALPHEVARFVTDELWSRFEGALATDSTNSDARALAHAGAPEGTVVTAAHQRAGRGRMGRSWVSPEGGAYVSAVLRPGVAPSSMGSLALVVALGIARGLEKVGVVPRLKWPNDVLLETDGRVGKLAGVLLEMTAEGDCVEWVVAGFGLNVRRTAEPPAEAAFASDVVPGLRVARAAAAALDGVAAAYRVWTADGFAPLLPAYLERFALLDEQVAVSDAGGAVRAEGIVQGVDADGRLLVLTAAGVVPVASGEVTLRA